MEDDAPPGVPEWVVTYGDMMSLLLTFFIMLVSMSEVVAEKKYRAVLESLAAHLGYPAAAVSPAGQSFPLNSLRERLDTLGSFSDESGRGGLKRRALDGSDMRVFRNREGDAVPAGSVAFAPGSADLLPTARLELAAIADRLAGKPNKIDVRVSAEGVARTGSPSLPVEAPRPGRRTTLAYRRAKAVVTALEAAGIRHDRLRVTIDPAPAAADATDRVLVAALDAFVGEIVGPREE